jgi:formylglycine-generating enzyme required for sulfatase activity
MHRAGAFLLAGWALALAACASPTPTPGSVVDGMVYVPEGESVMGSDEPAVCRLCPGDQEAVAPARVVATRPYWIDVYEVTNAQYRACEADGACQPPPEVPRGFEDYHTAAQYDAYPVTYVNWEMAEEYCEWLGKRLPTEAEWERAARGDEGQLYPWGDEFDQAQYEELQRRNVFPYAVNTYDDFSGWGIAGASGNVWEWTADWYGPYQTPHHPPDSGATRVLRGGFSQGYTGYFRFTARVASSPALVGRFVGLRCARDG